MTFEIINFRLKKLTPKELVTERNRLDSSIKYLEATEIGYGKIKPELFDEQNKLFEVEQEISQRKLKISLDEMGKWVLTEETYRKGD